MFFFVFIYYYRFICRRQRPERIGPRKTHAQTDPQKSRRLHQRPAVRDVRSVCRTTAHVAGASIDHVANDRTNSIRKAIRDGAHRTTVARDVTRR